MKGYSIKTIVLWFQISNKYIYLPIISHFTGISSTEIGKKCPLLPKYCINKIEKNLNLKNQNSGELPQ